MKLSTLFEKTVLCKFIWDFRGYCKLENTAKLIQNTNSTDKTRDEPKMPEPPTYCCMSGCSNCVWITYAEQLSEILKDSGESACREIMKNVEDPNMRTFLLTEMSLMKFKWNYLATNSVWIDISGLVQRYYVISVSLMETELFFFHLRFLKIL